MLNISVTSASFRGKKKFLSEGTISHFVNTYYYSAHEYPFRNTYSDDGPPKLLRHKFKTWHKERRNKLTASTFAGAIGLWPRRRVQLWREKIGQIKPFSGNFATDWSSNNENDIRVMYELITQNDVYSPTGFQIYKEQKHEWLACSPDGVVEQKGVSSRGVLELKCPYFGGEKEIMYPWKRIPLYCIPQAQGLMEIMNKEWMDLYVWTPNGSSLFKIHRDREYWDLLRSVLSDFWCKHVCPAKEIIRTEYSRRSYPFNQPEIQKLKPPQRHERHRDLVYKSKCVVRDRSELTNTKSKREIEEYKERGIRLGLIEPSTSPCTTWPPRMNLTPNCSSIEQFPLFT